MQISISFSSALSCAAMALATAAQQRAAPLGHSSFFALYFLHPFILQRPASNQLLEAASFMQVLCQHAFAYKTAHCLFNHTGKKCPFFRFIVVDILEFVGFNRLCFFL